MASSKVRQELSKSMGTEEQKRTRAREEREWYGRDSQGNIDGVVVGQRTTRARENCLA